MSVPQADDRPKILVLNQYYWPGVEATAQLLAQLCEALATEYEVTVVTGHLHGHDDLPSEEERNGVEDPAGALDVVRAVAAPPPRRELRELPRRYRAHRPPRRAARPGAVHDRSSRRRRHRPARRTTVRLAAPRHQPGRVPGDRTARQASREPARRRRAPPARRAVPSARRSGGRDRGDDEASPRGEGSGPRRGDPELGRHDDAHASAASQQLVEGARPRQGVRGDALGERRARAGSRHSRPRGDVPQRSRPAPDPGDRVRRAARRAHAPGAAPRGDQGGALPRLPAARGAPAVACHRRPPLRRSRTRALGVRRPEPPLRDPRGRAAGARVGRCGQRDRAARRGGRVRTGRRSRPPRARRRASSAMRSRSRRRSPAWARRRGRGSSRRPTARSRSRATGAWSGRVSSSSSR